MPGVWWRHVGWSSPQARGPGFRQRHAPTPRRSGAVVEGLHEHDTPPPGRALLPAAPTLTHQRRQGLAEGEVETRKDTGADRPPQCREALGPAAYTRDECRETAVGRLFDHLPLDPSGVGLLHRWL